jgi:hypothetical protein
MGKYFISIILIIVGIFGFIISAKADGWHGPECAMPDSVDPNGYFSHKQTCKMVINSFEFILSEDLKDEFVLLSYVLGSRNGYQKYEKGAGGKIFIKGDVDSTYRPIIMRKNDFDDIFGEKTIVFSQESDTSDGFLHFQAFKSINGTYEGKEGIGTTVVEGEKAISIEDMKDYLIPFENINDGLLKSSNGVIVLPMYTTQPIVNPLKSREYQYAVYGFKNGELILQETKKTYYFDDGTKQEWNFNLPNIKSSTPQQKNSLTEKDKTKEQSFSSDTIQSENNQPIVKKSIFTIIVDFFKKIFSLR